MDGVERSKRGWLEVGREVVQRVVEANQRHRRGNLPCAWNRGRIGEAHGSHRLDPELLARDEPVLVGEPAQQRPRLRLLDDRLDERRGIDVPDVSAHPLAAAPGLHSAAARQPAEAVAARADGGAAAEGGSTGGHERVQPVLVGEGNEARNRPATVGHLERLARGNAPEQPTCLLAKLTYTDGDSLKARNGWLEVDDQPLPVAERPRSRNAPKLNRRWNFAPLLGVVGGTGLEPGNRVRACSASVEEPAVDLEGKARRGVAELPRNEDDVARHATAHLQPLPNLPIY